MRKLKAEFHFGGVSYFFPEELAESMEKENNKEFYTIRLPDGSLVDGNDYLVWYNEKYLPQLEKKADAETNQ
jgi:hypothetical protein